MLDDLKITIIGTQGAGKICYLLAMYGLMQMGFRGFSLQAKNFDMHIEMNEKWHSLLDLKGWPSPTTETIQYSFDFCYGLKPILEIIFFDYRGCVLRDSLTENDSQKLLQYYKESDCLFLCVSGEYLKQAIVETDGKPDFRVRQKVATRLNLTIMNNLITELQQKLKPTSNNPFPVAIVITKYDLCMERGKEAIVQDIKQLFEPLFYWNSDFLTLICPVSLGKELADNLNIGGIDPINLDKPLLFAAYSLFCERFLSGQKENDKKWMNLLAQELRWSSLYLGNKEVTPNIDWD